MQLEQMKLQHAMQIEQMKVAIKEKELEVKMMEIEMRQHQEQERISLDERINSVKVSSDMQRETSKQMLDMKKFQAEIALKQQPLANPTGNYGVE